MLTSAYKIWGEALLTKLAEGKEGASLVLAPSWLT